MIEYKIKSEKKMLDFGKRLAACLKAPLFIGLKGNLGAGKTTLVRSILSGLGHVGSVKSPTYTLIETYELEALHVFHLDLYRIASPEELEFIGIDEMTQSDQTIGFIEWPEKGEGFLPDLDLVCEILIEESESRRLVLKGPALKQLCLR